MGSRQVFGVQSAGDLVLFALVAAWYWWPRLRRLGTVEALTPLLLLHLSRTVGLSMLVPSLTDASLPRSFAAPAAYGDLAAAVLALLAVLTLRWRASWGAVIAWVFTAEGTLDLLVAFARGARIDLPSFALGPSWFIFTVLVPALLVTHVMVAMILIRSRERDPVRIG